MENSKKSGLQLRNLWLKIGKPIGFDAPTNNELADYDRRFFRILHKHFSLLGLWSIVCLLGSIGGLIWLGSGQLCYFLMMSFVWGTINFAIMLGIFVGCWLREHSFRCGMEYAELWAGFGWAIIVQGIFLMVQDSCFTRLHHRNFIKARPYLQELLKKE